MTKKRLESGRARQHYVRRNAQGYEDPGTHCKAMISLQGTYRDLYNYNAECASLAEKQETSREDRQPPGRDALPAVPALSAEIGPLFSHAGNGHPPAGCAKPEGDGL